MAGKMVQRLMLRRMKMDARGVASFNPGALVGALIGVLIAVIIGFALVSTLLASVASVNATTKYETGSPIPGLMNLAPLLFVLGVVISTVAVVFVGLYLGMPGGGRGD